VGAFRFRVTAAEGMFKFSQEKPERVQRAVADSFAAAGAGRRGLAVAEVMYRFTTPTDSSREEPR
jgi:transcriptional regulator